LLKHQLFYPIGDLIIIADTLNGKEKREAEIIFASLFFFYQKLSASLFENKTDDRLTMEYCAGLR
jgi:hypothetical protein